jgi:hypothetical protein
MEEERYPGERRVLRLFLADLGPVAEGALGHDALLCHAIRRALATNALDAMRHARGLFNHLDREAKQALSEGLVRQAARGRGVAPAAQVRGAHPPLRLMSSFIAAAEGGAERD